MKKLRILRFLAVVLILVASSCNNDFQSLFDDYPDFIKWSATSATLTETSTDDFVITVQLVGAQRSQETPIQFELSANNAVEGVDYELPNGSNLVIPANSSTGTIVVRAVNNDIISDGARTLVFTLTSDNELDINKESAGTQVFTLSLLDDDFWCPRNLLSQVVGYENDVGYSSKPVSISASATPDGCLSFSIKGGMTTNFNFPGGDATYGPIELVEDSPESNTGTVKDGQFNVVNSAGNTWTLGGQPLSVKIMNGVYNLEEGFIMYDYEVYVGQDFQYPGTFIYSASPDDWQ